MSAQAFKTELITYYQNLANQGVNLEEHRNQKLLKTYNQLNSPGLKFRRCLRGAVFGILPAGGAIHTEMTSRAYAKRCMKAYCLEALDYPTTNAINLVLEAGLDAISNSITEMVADEAIEAAMDFFIDNTVDNFFDNLTNRGFGHVPLFSCVTAVIDVQKAMNDVLTKAHAQAELLHNSAIETVKGNMETNVRSLSNEEPANLVDVLIWAIILLVLCYLLKFGWGLLSH